MKGRGWLLVLGILFIAANLRSPLTSVGPLVGSIHDSLGISNTMAGSLTTIPLLAFAVFSTFAPRIAERFGMAPVLLVSLALLAVGIILRSLSGVGTLVTGTVLLGLSIAVCNVLLPGLIKEEFPKKVGIMTGSYSVSMNLCGAIASGISVPIAHTMGMGWSGALGCWGILTVVSLLLWLPQMRFHRKSVASREVEKEAKTVHLWRSNLAWKITLFMGLQSLLFYTIVSWFPEILRQRGFSADAAGWMVSLMQFAVLPVTFIVPIIAARMASQRTLAAISAGLFLLGIFGIASGNSTWTPLWFIMIGVGVGSSFSLAMMFFALRTQNTHEAAALSGMAQSIGYLLAAIGPTLFGLLHDVTHNWNVPLVMLEIASILLLLFGLGAGRNRYIHSNDSEKNSFTN
ncbi:MFS transporter [Aneurinibacillus sp. Ricciae_BoGa-3]|uniref:CynX/NimT family MFS transporter n=1 Tax=Aneurinibacillus sp. Ricciae_BoGa-3 TaxID=3022697 RepID=UPI002340A65E|nr:MFS transporter [Aneurinibacillus sp. Ricciae_BoGa-3]WCK56724.1 MFS transporter [Aneurinibacillus sp. Ricciae_BoGa-3]